LQLYLVATTKCSVVKIQYDSTDMKRQYLYSAQGSKNPSKRMVEFCSCEHVSDCTLKYSASARYKTLNNSIKESKNFMVFLRCSIRRLVSG
jgi:hypothetical protein